MAKMLAQGPQNHCSDEILHEKHENPLEGAPTAWCSGVPTLQPFVELAIRVPVKAFFGTDPAGDDHLTVLHMFVEEGLVIILDEMTEEGSATVLRVRTADGEDRVYPIIKGVPKNV